MHKDSSLFTHMLNQFDKRFGRKAVSKLVATVHELDRILERLPNTPYHIDKATGLERLVDAYAGGFQRIARSCGIGPGDDFDWLAEQYGAAIQSGSDDTLWGVEYLSFESGKGKSAILGIFPEDMEHDSYVRTYQMALRMPDTHLKKKHDVAFQDDINRVNTSTAQPFRNVYIKIKAE